jgi:hypothetical protein
MLEIEHLRWLRLFGQVFRSFKWKDYSASRRGCGKVKIGFIDFQGLVGRAENSSIVSALSMRPAFPQPASSRVRPPELLANGGSIPGRESVPPGWSAAVGSYKTRSKS